ncbi:PA2169 family four-helix-bundle protein [Marinicella litoralis]|uniref:Uncharacterized protein (TIGR02284 family) n=1 Tax=Marinicella litoralis TaxID=644220 RepID=A0A4R6XM32_9GAMM|nr:PA2169 family four-helix-bundle protein [Marinicella litoralis]TDR20705.1 uncharacterized protein (TIGR02284 family) [Marinicella litoralis]
MNNQKNIEILNDVTAKLIDSCKGYQMCAEVSEDNLLLKNQFLQRHNDRKIIVNEFQNKIKSLGGEVEDTGTMGGSLHRGFTKFISVFKDDSAAAIDALDTGEEHLANYIADKIKEEEISTDAALLLNRAHASAVSGERFADLLDG